MVVNNPVKSVPQAQRFLIFYPHSHSGLCNLGLNQVALKPFRGTNSGASRPKGFSCQASGLLQTYTDTHARTQKLYVPIISILRDKKDAKLSSWLHFIVGKEIYKDKIKLTPSKCNKEQSGLNINSLIQ